MKFRSTDCPEMYSILDRFKSGDMQRDLHNRCKVTKQRCMYATTSKTREKIPAEKIKNCPLRRR